MPSSKMAPPPSTKRVSPTPPTRRQRRGRARTRRRARARTQSRRGTTCPPCPPPTNVASGVGFEKQVDAVFRRNGINLSQTSYNLEKQVVRDLKQAVKPHGIQAHDDFYAHVNDRWIQQMDRVANDTYLVQLDNFRVVQDQTFRQLLQWTRELLTTPAKAATLRLARGPREHMTAALWSFERPMRLDDIRSHAHAWLQRLHRLLPSSPPDASPSKAPPHHATWRAIAVLNRNEIVSPGAPVVFHVAPNERELSEFVGLLDAPALTLPNPELYLAPSDDALHATRGAERKQHEADNAAHRAVMRAYRTYLDQLFVTALGAAQARTIEVEDVIQTEIMLYEAMRAEPDLPAPLRAANHQEMYYTIPAGRAEAWFGLPWPDVARALGFARPPAHFVTTNPTYLVALGQLVQRLPPAAWRTYFLYLYIRQLARHSAEGAKIHFAFHGAALRGQTEMVDADLRPIFGLAYCFPTTLSRLYATHQRDPAMLTYASRLADDLRRVFVRILRRNAWMQPATKRAALDKLAKLRFHLGSLEYAPLDPGEGASAATTARAAHQHAVTDTVASAPSVPAMDDPMLAYSATDAWSNLVRMAEWKRDAQIQRLWSAHRPARDAPWDLTSVDWSATPPKLVGSLSFLVNAMYTPTTNAITVPLGYLQRPFVDLRERGIEYNLAHLGFTLAHEMSHALDDLGSQYDARGRLQQWWTPRDLRRFRQIQEDIVRQYHAYMQRDGLELAEEDAWNTIGEDLADISGLAICQEYLRDVQLRNQDVLPIQSLSFEAFFIFFAIQSRQRVRKAAVHAQMKTNPHPLDKYRCNVPLSRSRIFRATYGVKRGHGMWWHNVHSVWSE